MKNTPKTLKRLSSFIVFSVVLKLGTLSMHFEAKFDVVAEFEFRSRNRAMDEKCPKAVFYPT